MEAVKKCSYRSDEASHRMRGEAQSPGKRPVLAKSRVAQRSVLINGHKKSLTIESEFWAGLREIAAEKEITLGALVCELDAKRKTANLSATIRLFVLNYYMEKAGCPANG